MTGASIDVDVQDVERAVVIAVGDGKVDGLIGVCAFVLDVGVIDAAAEVIKENRVAVEVEGVRTVLEINLVTRAARTKVICAGCARRAVEVQEILGVAWRSAAPVAGSGPIAIGAATVPGERPAAGKSWGAR